MPTLQKHLHGANRSFDARPDRFDLRDRIYQPKLVNLPPEYPTKQAALGMLKAYAPLVLDQGSEGACTGFGLAAGSISCGSRMPSLPMQ